MNCEICKIKSHHKHHIISKSKGGSNRKNNLVHLCSNCHYMVHRGEIIIEGWFMTTEGIKLIWHKKGNESFTNSSPDVYIF